jgi:molybdopterin synthase sulfur carrier subunit
MSVTIRIPTALRGFTGGLTEVVASGVTLNALLDDMEAQHGGIKQALCDEHGRPPRFVAIFVNGVDVRTLQGMKTAVAPDAEIDIVSAIAGG